MYACRNKVVFSAVVLLLMVKTAVGINCYQCSGTESSHPFQCNEFLDDTDLEAKSCESVYNAKYCIKHVGRFEGYGIMCYQCSSNTSMDCGDGMIHMGGIVPRNCDQVFEAQYCIKMTGGIGTKRYCSPLDLGNYCDYVKQPGDILEYRSCVYTCTGDGCNSTIASASSNNILLIFNITLLYLLYFHVVKCFILR